jgi:pyruvate, water dikinase
MSPRRGQEIMLACGRVTARCVEEEVMKQYIRNFDKLGLKDIGLVGGKNASLGELISELAGEGIRVPGGFVVTADAYSKLIVDIEAHLRNILSSVDKADMDSLSAAGRKARALIRKAGLPGDVEMEIRLAYREMESQYGPDVDVAVRSSATAEDLPDASFAGQQESFLNVRGEDALLEACLNCFASLFTDCVSRR